MTTTMPADTQRPFAEMVSARSTAGCPIANPRPA
jgi:hypothetical protein